MTQIAKFQFRGDDLEVVIESSDDTWIVVRRWCETMGLEPDSQRRRLQDPDRSPWARTTVMVVPDSRGHAQELFCLHRRSLPMWLATIDSSRVSDVARAKIVSFQCESADALDRHFNTGVAFNPRVIGPESEAAAAQIRHRAAIEIALMARDYLPRDYLTRVTQHSISLLMGTAPESSDGALLDVGEYLAGRGIGDAQRRSVGGKFGKRLKALYIEARGQEPGKIRRLVGGSERSVCTYAERDRPLFDRAFDEIMGPK